MRMLMLMLLVAWSSLASAQGEATPTFFDQVPCGNVEQALQRQYDHRIAVAEMAYEPEAVGVSDEPVFGLLSCVADFRDLGVSIGSAIPSLAGLFSGMVDRLRDGACNALGDWSNQMKQQVSVSYNAPFDLFDAGVVNGTSGVDFRGNESSDTGLNNAIDRGVDRNMNNINNAGQNTINNYDQAERLERSLRNQSNDTEGDVNDLILRR